MSRLQITTFADVGAVPLGAPLAEEVVEIDAKAHVSGPLEGESVKVVVRLFAEVPCYVTWGENPKAKDDGNSGRMLSAESPEYFSIEGGHRVSVIERV